MFTEIFNEFIIWIIGLIVVLFIVKILLLAWDGYSLIKLISEIVPTKLSVNIHKEKLENGDEKITYSVDDEPANNKRIEPTFKDK